MQSPILSRDPIFFSLLASGAQLQQVVTGFGSVGGPLFSRLGFLLFSDVEAEQIIKWTPDPGRSEPPGGQQTVFRRSSNGARGLTFDHQGRLLACEEHSGRVTRTEKGGQITVMAEAFAGRSLNGPWDLIYAIDGSIYFSDPWPVDSQTRPNTTGFSAIYQITRRGQIRLSSRRLAQPKGIALGPKQLTLYVSDAGHNSVWSFKIRGDGSLSEGEVRIQLGPGRNHSPTGLNTDEGGYLYVATPAGVQVFSPSGRKVGSIVTPEAPDNCAWGAGFRGLYLTAGTSVYYIPTQTSGTRTF